MSESKLRFAVAFDLHYAQPDTPFDDTTRDMVTWLNDERKEKGLVAIFLNGDIIHDSSPALLRLRDEHLTKLETPYYVIKGNHDFLDPNPASPSAMWERILHPPCPNPLGRS